MMICAAALVLSAAAPASASESVGYGGIFDGPIVYDTCSTSDDQAIDPGTNLASGTWRVNLHDQKATARFVINVNSAPHVAYTAQLTRLPSDATFEATMITGAGPLVVKLVGDAFTYKIARYDYTEWGGFRCESVTYSGTLAP